jgi:S1-C subfamily serine protease
MKFIKLTILITIISTLLLPYTAQSAFLSEEEKTVNVAKQLRDSVVMINSLHVKGSGFFITPHEVITNAHVVESSKSVFVTQANGQMCLADVAYTSTNEDLALIQTDCTGTPLNQAKSVTVGQTVITMGNPLGEAFYVSKGIVGLVDSNGLLHDAMIEKGMSGGPLVNVDGELMGVTKAYALDAPKIGIAITLEKLNYFLYEARK